MEEINSFKSYLEDLTNIFSIEKELQPLPTFRNRNSHQIDKIQGSNYHIWKNNVEVKKMLRNENNIPKKIVLDENKDSNSNNNTEGNEVNEKENEPVLITIKNKTRLILGVAEYTSKYENGEDADETSALLGGCSSTRINMQYNSTNDEREILKECDLVTSMANSAVHKLIQRGEAIVDIKARADSLKGAGKLFKKKAVNVERDSYVQSLKFILSWDRSCVGAPPGTVWGCGGCIPGTVGCPIGAPAVPPIKLPGT
ncbi:hypothetical protein HK099_000783 [Clydaea vesicula]|uniref:V-SNARE coiled-coil homology domain-containing protein n=1 Tax=Clydaea vesicula TaxID=447962 RepID=A0AAD5U8W1_9FUNG|nr:hypothetical protein HK099_000783 [Clydaea vesicula]